MNVERWNNEDLRLRIELSIITVNYNGLEDTCELIESIPSDESIEVIVVDNASKADEASELSRRYPQVRVIRSDTNLGFAGGNNLGIEASQGDYLFFINNDTILKGNNEDKLKSLQSLVSFLKKDSSIGAVCPKLRFTWDTQPIQYAGYTPLSSVTMRNSSIGYGESDCGQYDTPHPTPYAHGAAMMVSRKAIAAAGVMPTCFFLYYEELDWSMMIRRAGFDIWYNPVLTVFHKESRTTGQNSPLRTYYITRNRLLFARRNIKAPRRWLTYAYLIFLVAPRDIIKNIAKRKVAVSRATLSGVCDFFRGVQGFRAFSPKGKVQGK